MGYRPSLLMERSAEPPPPAYEGPTQEDLDQEEPEVGEEAAPTVTPRVTPAPAARGRGYKPSLLQPKPEPVPEPEPAQGTEAEPPISVPSKPQGEQKAAGEAPIGSGSAVVRGLVGGITGSIEDAGAAGDVALILSGGDKNSAFGQLAAALGAKGKEAGTGYEQKAPGFLDIRSADEALTWLGETVGNAIGSSAPSLVGGLAVGGVGAAVGGPGGAAAGLYVGSGAPAVISGVGNTFRQLKDDKEIQQFVKDGKITEEQLAKYALGGGLVVGALDTLPNVKFARLAGGSKAVNEFVAKAVTQAIKHGIKEGIGSEGITEGLQEVIQQGLTGYLGDNPDLLNRAKSVVNAAIAGAFGGAALGGGTAAAGAVRQGLPLTAPKDSGDATAPATANPATPGTTSGTGSPPPAGAAPGVDTPGGPAPGPATQPAGAPTQAYGESDYTKAPPTVEGAGKTAPAAQTPPAAGAVDPSIGAALGVTPAQEETGDYSDLTEEDEARIAKERPAAPATAGAAPAAVEVAEKPGKTKTRTARAQSTQAATTDLDAEAALKTEAPPAAPPAEAVQPVEPPAAPTTTPPGGPIPETPATLDEQRGQLANGERKAVQYPVGTRPAEPVPGMLRVTVPGHGVFDFDPKQVTREQVIAAAREGRENELLGLGPFNKAEVMATPGPEMAVAERTPEGTEVRAAGAKPATAPIQQAAMEAGKTPGNIVAPEPIDETLARRGVETPAAPAPSVRPLQTTAAIPSAGSSVEQPGVVSAPAREPTPAPSQAPAPAPTAAPGAAPGPSPTDLAARQAAARAKREAAEKASYAPPAEATAPAAPAAPRPKLSAKPGANLPETKPPVVAAGTAGKAKVEKRTPRVGPKAEKVMARVRERQAEVELPKVGQEPAERARAEVREHVREKLEQVFNERGNVIVDEEAVQRVEEAIDEGVTEHLEAGMQPATVAAMVKHGATNEAIARAYDDAAGKVGKRRAEAEEKHRKAEAEVTVEARRTAEAEDIAKREGKGTKEEKERVRDTNKYPLPENIRSRKREDFEVTAVNMVAKLGTNADPWFQDAAQAVQERKPVSRGRGAAMIAKRAPFNARINAALEEWARASEEHHAAREEARPVQPTKEEEVEEQARAAALDEEEKAKAAEAAKAARYKELDDRAREAAKHIPDGMWDIDDMRDAVTEAAKEAGAGLPTVVTEAKGGWANLISYAQRTLKRRDLSPDEKTTDIHLARHYLQKGELKEAFNHMRGAEKGAGKLTTAAAESEEGGTQEREMPKVVSEAVQDWVDQMNSDTDYAHAAAERDGTTLENGSTGFTHELTGEPVAAKDLLAKTSVTEFAGRLGNKLFKTIDEMVAKTLAKLVGHVPVHRVPREVVKQLGNFAANVKNPDAFYAKPSPEAAARGEVGVIVMADDVPAERLRHVLMHEMTHAATLQGLVTDYLGSGRIFKGLFEEAKAAAEAHGIDTSKHYGFSSTAEFISEAMSNPVFQEMLAQLSVSPKLALRVRALVDGTKPSLWQMFTNTVARIIQAAGFGRRGITYTDAVLRTFGAATADPAMLRQHLMQFQGTEMWTRGSKLRVNGRAVGEKGAQFMPKPTESSIDGDVYDLPLISQQMNDAAAAMKAAARDVAGEARFDIPTKLRRLRNRVVSNTMDLMRRAMGFPGWENSPLITSYQAHFERENLRAEYERPGAQLGFELNDFAKRKRSQADRLSDVLERGSVMEIDPRRALTDPENAHINNTNPRFQRHRAEHKELHSEWNALDADAQALGHKLVNHYTDMKNREVTGTATQIVQAAVDGGLATLPVNPLTGQQETVDTVADWVTSGQIDKPAATQSQRDKDLHAALTTPTGSIITRLKDATGLREVKGVYVPRMRRGEFAVVADVNYHQFKPYVPPAQQVAGEHYLPDGATAWKHNELRFTDRAKYDAFTKNAQYQPAGNVRISMKGGFTAIVPTQNRYLSFHQKEHEARRAREDLVNSGIYTNVDEVQHRRDRTQEEFETALTGLQVDSLLKSMAQSGVVGNMYDIVKGAIVRTQIQKMGGTRAQHRRLKRAGTHGSSHDMVRALLDSNAAAAGYLASLEKMPIIEAGLKWAKDEMARQQGDPQIMRKQENVAEFERRVRDQSGYSTPGALRTFLTLSYINHLFSPAFLAMQYTQPLYSTLPALAGDYGVGATVAAMGRAMKLIGGGAVYAKGWKGAAQAAAFQNITDDPVVNIRARPGIAGTKYEQVLDKLQSYGLLDAEAGQELERAKLDMNILDKVMDYPGQMLKAVAGSVEAANRTMTGIAAYDLATTKGGMTHEQALEYAAHQVEQTQYGYGRANAPTIFSNPLGRTVLQFKKYALGMGNFLARQIYHSLKGQTPAKRKAAAKALFFTLSVFALTSGLSGGFPWEILKLPYTALAMATGWKDWDELENMLQGAIAAATGNKKAAEVIMRGLPRLLGFDLSNRISLSSLLLFGQPKKQDPEAQKAWLFDTLLGAPASMAMQTLEAMRLLNRGNFSDAISKLPLPKVLRDSWTAYKLHEEGRFTKTGKQVEKPISTAEAIGKGLGFKPASEAEAWEYGGGGEAWKQKTKEQEEKSLASAPWHKAAALKDEAGKRKAFEDIQKGWNKDHPKNQIKLEDLRKSQERSKTEQKKLKKQSEAA